MPGLTHSPGQLQVLASFVHEFLQGFKYNTPLLDVMLDVKKELIRMLEGTHEKGWTWVNTGAELLCMMENRS